MWYTHLLFILPWFTLLLQVIFIILLILKKLEDHNGVLFKLVFACFSISALHCVVGSVCSGMTVCKLYHITGDQDYDKRSVSLAEKRKSAITIFLMNIPHFVTAGCIFTSIVSPQGISWFDINFIFCPILTSTLNPILIVTRSTAIKRMVRDHFRVCGRKLVMGTNTMVLQVTSSQDTATGRATNVSSSTKAEH